MKKKSGIILAAVCAAILACSAIVPAQRNSNDKNVYQVIQKYRSYKGVESINIGPFIMKLARLTGTEEAKWVNRVAILSVEQCDARSKTINSIEDEMKQALVGYETFLEANEEDEKVKILVKSSKDAETILEMVIFAKETDELSVVAIKGNIPVSQIMEVAEMAEELD